MVKIKGNAFVLVGCKSLTKEEIDFRKKIMRNKPQNKNGYMCFVDKNRKSHRRGRLMVELACGLKLKKTIHIHHINGIKDDDRYSNFEMLKAEEHASLTHAGKRRKNLNRGVQSESVQSRG